MVVFRLMRIIKRPDDSLFGRKVLRISIGGPADGSVGAYLTYRGDLREVQQMLRDVVEVFNDLVDEPPLDTSGDEA